MITTGINHCFKCGGLIPEPGYVYGYVGKFCQCPKPIEGTEFFHAIDDYFKDFFGLSGITPLKQGKRPPDTEFDWNRM